MKLVPGHGGRPLLRAGAHPPAGALLAGCAIVIIATGALVAGQVKAGPLDARIDAWITAWLAGHHRAATGVVEIGDPDRLAIIGAVVAVACAATRRFRGALLVAVAVPLAGAITDYALKPLFDRTISGNLSYPSGHVTGVSAMAAAVVVLLIGPARPPVPAALRWLLAAVAALAVAAVAVGVVALGYHYFTDTIGGAAAGTGTAVLTALALDWLAARLPRRGRAASESAARDGMPAAERGLPRT